jgi:hypothetical protein
MARRRTRTASFSSLGIPSEEELEHFAAQYEREHRGELPDLDWEERERKSRRAKRRRRKRGELRRHERWLAASSQGDDDGSTRFSLED